MKTGLSASPILDGTASQYLYDGTASQYLYDGTGRRVQSDEQGAVTQYLYDGLSAVIERGDSNVSYTRGLGYGGGIGSIISALRDGETTYYHYNGIGGVTGLTDPDTNLVESYAYDAFGNILEANGLVANPYGFSTKEYNAKSGLIYFGARYYDPRIGRFITKDPLTWGPDDPRVLSTPNQPEPFKGIISQNRGVLNPDTIMNAFNPFERQKLRKAIIFDTGKEIPSLFNRYVYCVNNPVLFVDPRGLLWKERIFIGGVSMYKLIGPVKVYIRGLGWIKPLTITSIPFWMLLDPSESIATEEEELQMMEEYHQKYNQKPEK